MTKRHTIEVISSILRTSTTNDFRRMFGFVSLYVRSLPLQEDDNDGGCFVKFLPNIHSDQHKAIRCVRYDEGI